ncbi:Hypothetical predicted protein, partial [Pelobates cultripes]
MPLVGPYPEPGDLIEFFRTVYQHWGIYVGSGHVVHLTVYSGLDNCLAEEAVPGSVQFIRLHSALLNFHIDSSYLTPIQRLVSFQRSSLYPAGH